MNRAFFMPTFHKLKVHFFIKFPIFVLRVKFIAYFCV